MRILAIFKRLKLTAVMCLLPIVLSSCAAASAAFVPNTMAAARCKRDCTSTYHSCRLANCDSSFASCMDYCMDIDRISSRK